ncbi:hypothetical protein TNCV_4915411 [Trichonephila clavipes]|nr:hypothetical protein TNCV_4915411 [Trichonephila clavipes]
MVQNYEGTRVTEYCDVNIFNIIKMFHFLAAEAQWLWSRARGGSVMGSSSCAAEDPPSTGRPIHVKFMEVQCPSLGVIARREGASSGVVLVI